MCNLAALDFIKYNNIIVIDVYFSKTINSRPNQAVMNRLVKEVKGLNPSMDAADIRSKLIQHNEMCYSFREFLPAFFNSVRVTSNQYSIQL